MATLIGYLQLVPVYAWTPVGGHADPRAGSTQEGGFPRYLYGAVPEDGTLTLQFGAGDYVESNVIYILYDPTTGHHYAGTAGDPYPVYQDPTADMYWDYEWQRWYGDFSRVVVSYYSDVERDNSVESSASVVLPAGMFHAYITTVPPPPVPATLGYGVSSFPDHAYEWLVESRSNGGTMSLPIKSPARYFQVGVVHFGNNPYLYPAVTFKGASISGKLPPWPYGQGMLQAQANAGGAIEAIHASDTIHAGGVSRALVLAEAVLAVQIARSERLKLGS